MGNYLCKDAEHAKQAKKENYDNDMLPASEKPKKIEEDVENPDIPFADATGDEDDVNDELKNGKVVNDYNQPSVENQDGHHHHVVAADEHIKNDHVKPVQEESISVDVVKTECAAMENETEKIHEIKDHKDDAPKETEVLISENIKAEESNQVQQSVPIIESELHKDCDQDNSNIAAEHNESPSDVVVENIIDNQEALEQELIAQTEAVPVCQEPEVVEEQHDDSDKVDEPVSCPVDVDIVPSVEQHIKDHEEEAAPVNDEHVQESVVEDSNVAEPEHREIDEYIEEQFEQVIEDSPEAVEEKDVTEEPHEQQEEVDSSKSKELHQEEHVPEIEETKPEISHQVEEQEEPEVEPSSHIEEQVQDVPEVQTEIEVPESNESEVVPRSHIEEESHEVQEEKQDIETSESKELAQEPTADDGEHQKIDQETSHQTEEEVQEEKPEIEPNSHIEEQVQNVPKVEQEASHEIEMLESNESEVVPRSHIEEESHEVQEEKQDIETSESKLAQEPTVDDGEHQKIDQETSHQTEEKVQEEKPEIEPSSHIEEQNQDVPEIEQGSSHQSEEQVPEVHEKIDVNVLPPNESAPESHEESNQEVDQATNEPVECEEHQEENLEDILVEDLTENSSAEQNIDEEDKAHLEFEDVPNEVVEPEQEQPSETKELNEQPSAVEDKSKETVDSPVDIPVPQEPVADQLTNNAFMADIDVQHISSNGIVKHDTIESDDQSLSNELEFENGGEDVKEEELRQMVSDAVDGIMGDAKTEVQHIVEKGTCNDQAIEISDN